MRFKLGDQVEWTSQSNGVAKMKRGKVVVVVPAFIHPRSFAELVDSFGCDIRKSEWGGHRTAESYLVLVPGKTPRARVKVYWPRVPQLQAMGIEQPEYATEQ